MSDKNKTRSAVQISMLISKVEDKYYLALDGRTNELEEFNIGPIKLNELAEELEKATNKVLRKYD